MGQLYGIWIVLLGAVIVVGAVLALIRLRLPEAKLSNTTVLVARDRLVLPFLDSLEDGRFGFPSGKFVAKATADNRIVAREAVWWRPSTIDLSKRLWQGASQAGFVGRLVARAILGIYWLWLGLFATAGEMLAKVLLRSTITATLTQVDPSNCTVVFTTRGPCALLLRQRLLDGFAAPRLPASIAQGAGIVGPEAA